MEHDRTLTSKSVNWECWDSLSCTLPQLWSVLDLKEIFQNHFPFHILALVTSSKLWSQQVSCLVWFHLEAFRFLHPKDVTLLSFLKVGWKPNIRLWHSFALKKDHYFYQHYGILPIVNSCIIESQVSALFVGLVSHSLFLHGFVATSKQGLQQILSLRLILT